VGLHRVGFATRTEISDGLGWVVMEKIAFRGGVTAGGEVRWYRMRQKAVAESSEGCWGGGSGQESSRV
jgi:hypothetical protein